MLSVGQGASQCTLKDSHKLKTNIPLSIYCNSVSDMQAFVVLEHSKVAFTTQKARPVQYLLLPTCIHAITVYCGCTRPIHYTSCQCWVDPPTALSWAWQANAMKWFTLWKVCLQDSWHTKQFLTEYNPLKLANKMKHKYVFLPVYKLQWNAHTRTNIGADLQLDRAP